jgi:hypothetical protein
MNQPNPSRIFVRNTTENHTDTPPVCDEACRRRWGDMAHIHVCPDGINAPTPFMTVTSWCSCGALLGEPLDYDVRKPASVAALANRGRRTFERFQLHALTVHKIDIETDEEWQRRLTTPAGPL